ncbi:MULTISPECIES: hypothetical protein [Pseudomonas]|uniref:hypothetical protein n=1 Tax=Pseudomonas TaxID=286 RepID=UPI000281CF11|nr:MULTISPECIES: hypothetical protein [Pseudomonas]QBQ09213.1 hypothetical protein DCC84_05450 [Pseudomonas sp. SXM-1]QQD54457.1 hypothetical protein MHB_0030860 [Pseudomonas fluorescens BBc6R8]
MKKPPLYRSVNTRTHNVRHGSCRTYRQQRHSKSEKTSMLGRGSMHSHHRHGFDYTPLFRFLLSKVGHQWDAIFSEANSRLDRPDPVFWMVALHESEKSEYVRTDESTYYSGLYVDETGLLQKVNPQLTPAFMKPFCDCCTHTFNGVVFPPVPPHRR